ncbi:Syntaxin-51 [Dionaea muscipula]
MASTLSMSNFANRDSLLGLEIKPVDAVSRTSGLVNQGIVGLQRQVMREQDEGLEKLEETVTSTKHIALAVNEELDLQTRLIDTLDYQVEATSSWLRVHFHYGIPRDAFPSPMLLLCSLFNISIIYIIYQPHVGGHAW